MADRERAVGVARGASLYERLADKIEETGGDPLPALLHAAELDPANAEYRMRVGCRRKWPAGWMWRSAICWRRPA